MAHETYATSMSLAQVFEPAIEYAERGGPLTVFDQMMFAESGGRLAPESAKNYLPEGRVADVGALFVQRDLAATLRQIATQGIGYLYDGPLGHLIDRLMRERGGLVTTSDLRSYPERVRWVSPLQSTYRGVTVYVPPPSTSAVQVLETLNALSHYDLANAPHLGPEHITLTAEAARAVRMDTEQYIADPDFASVPVEHLLSGEHTHALRQEVERRLAARGHRDPTASW